MTSKEFSIKCRPYNLKYRDIFGDIPCPQDYTGTQDGFFKALTSAVEERKPISEYLKKTTIPLGENLKI